MHMQILLTYWDRDFLRDDLVTVTKQRLIEIVTGLLTMFLEAILKHYM